MEIPNSLEELAIYVDRGKNVLFFTADWCGDCTFIKPSMPEIEAEFPEYTFVQVDRDQFLTICEKWGVMGIPSFIVLEDGKELGRLVNKARKTKSEITTFLQSI